MNRTFPFLLAALLALSAASPLRAAESPVPWRPADPRLTAAPRTAHPLRTTPNVVELEREKRSTEITRILRERPDDLVLRKELAALRLLDGRDDEAARIWYEVARIDGTDREALSGLAACMLRAGSHDAAARLLAEMRERGIAGPSERLNLAYAYFAGGRFEPADLTLRAVEEEERAKAEPDDTILENARYNLAVVAYSLDHPGEAEAWLEKVRDGDEPAP